MYIYINLHVIILFRNYFKILISSSQLSLFISKIKTEMPFNVIIDLTN